LIDGLVKQYPFLDSGRLKNQLSVIYSDHDILGGIQTLYEMLSFIYANDLVTCMPELFKFLSVVVTIPVTSASVERSFSTLKSIKTYVRNTMDQGRLRNLSIISINKDFVKALSEDNNFYD
jgi:hypothetical protein